MKIRSLQVLFCSIFLFGAYSCETELDINADYKTIPVIYGLLDATESVHLLKINKTFLGNGNAFEFAKNADSSSFVNLNAIVEQVKNGNVVKTYQLDDTLIGGKDSGVFYNNASKYYYFIEPSLDINAVYRVKFMADGKEVVATTPIIGPSNITTPRAAAAQFSLVSSAVDQGEVSDYTDLTVVLTSANNAAYYEFFYRFYYTENYTDGTSKEKIIELQGNPVTTLRGAGSNVFSEISGRSVFDRILSEVKPDPKVKNRVIGDFEYIVYSSGEEFYNYLSVNRPVTGVVLDRPEYTNVSNGIGIFNTRYRQSLRKPLNLNAQRAFVQLNGFQDLKFCSVSPELSGDPKFFCQ